MALNGQNSHFFMLIICCHAQGVSSKLGCTYSLKLRKYQSIYCLKNLKMAIFQQKNGQKMALNGPNSYFFYVYPMLPCSRSIQLIGMRLFFKINEVRVDLLSQNHENGHFSTKNGQKMALNGPNSHFFIWILSCHAKGVSS